MTNHETAWSILKIAILQKPEWAAKEVIDLMFLCELESGGHPLPQIQQILKKEML